MGIGRVLDETARLREELARRDLDLAAHQVLIARQAADLAARDALVAAQQAELADQKARLDAVVASNERLARQIALIEAARERRNERYEVDPAQLPLPPLQAPVPPVVVEDDGEAEEPSGGTRKERRKNRGRRPPPANLPREPVDHPVDDELKTCPICQATMPAGEPVTSVRYEWEPGRWKVLEVSQQTCACPLHPEAAVVADHRFALPNSIAGNGMLAHVLTDKFADHIPLNRQVARMEREGVTFSTSTLSDLVAASARVLSPIVEQIMRELLAGSFIQTDDTGFPVQDGTDGKLRKGRLWTYTNGELVVYRFTGSKHAEHPKQHLAGFKGKVLLADGGTEFNGLDALDRGGCWFHGRRKVFDARDGDPQRAGVILGAIRQLALIERTLVDKTPAERLAERQRLSKPIVDGLYTWLQAQSPALRPSSPMADAIGYLVRQRTRLTAFLRHGEIPMHNNLSELLLRQPVVGRKNWMFAGSQGGAEAAAVIFSLVGSCMLQGIDPWAYLFDVLGRLDEPPSQLTPAAWREARATTAS